MKVYLSLTILSLSVFPSTQNSLAEESQPNAVKVELNCKCRDQSSRYIDAKQKPGPVFDFHAAVSICDEKTGFDPKRIFIDQVRFSDEKRGELCVVTLWLNENQKRLLELKKKEEPLAIRSGAYGW